MKDSRLALLLGVLLVGFGLLVESRVGELLVFLGLLAALAGMATWSRAE